MGGQVQGAGSLHRHTRTHDGNVERGAGAAHGGLRERRHMVFKRASTRVSISVVLHVFFSFLSACCSFVRTYTCTIMLSERSCVPSSSHSPRVEAMIGLLCMLVLVINLASSLCPGARSACPPSFTAPPTPPHPPPPNTPKTAPPPPPTSP